ncbi:geranylgeranylglyceryl/heptaprenylglyceryl phosphate synthase [Bacteroidota bacterium]
MILNTIYQKIKQKEKIFSLLIDPDKYELEELTKTISIASKNKVDLLLIGGSLISKNLNSIIDQIKKICKIPVVLFPGSCLQISDFADGILFLSLISGRNPDFLIGSHVVAAPMIKNTGLEVIPTGYILINGNNATSVQYMSNTTPIPPDKIDIITATAMAGEMLGLKLLYLEAGSGAKEPINPNIVKEVKKSVKLPIIVGGGLTDAETLTDILDAGADMVVVGNAIENEKSILEELIKTTKNF